MPLGGQAPDEPQQHVLLLGTDQVPFGVVTLRRQDRHIIDRDLLPAAAVPVPVGDQVMGDPVQPGGEGNTSVGVVLMWFIARWKTGPSILRIMQVPRSIVNVVEDPVDVAFIEQAKSFLLALRCTVKNFFFVEINVRHG